MNKKNLIVVIIAALVVVGIVLIAEKENGNVAQAPSVTNGVTASGTPALPAATSSVSSTPARVASSTAPSVSVSIFSVYNGASFSFHYPLSWNLGTLSPFSINNFRNAYASDGSIPAGGAEVDIATTTTEGNLQSIMQTELMSAKNLTTKTGIIDGVSCAEAQYTSTYTSGVPSNNAGIYCEKGHELWKIYLSFRASDSASTTAQHVSDFNMVLTSMKLLP